MIGKDSKKLQVVMPKKEAERIEKMAEDDSRSVSNLLYRLIKKAVEKKRK